MNISLTWANYALITGACLVGYYLVIGLVYCRKDWLQFLQVKQTKSASITRNQVPVATVPTNFWDPSLSGDAGAGNNELANSELQEVQLTVEDFMDEIYAYTETCGDKISKEELGIRVRRILLKYPSLINSSLGTVLASIVATASENNCSIQWSEDELNELWNG